MNRSCTFSPLIVFTVILLVTNFALAGSATQDSAVRSIELEIQNREVQLESRSIRVTQGEQVELVWTSDEKASLHLHGYDIEFEVGPDGPAIYRFQARATGRFPITSHGFADEAGQGHQALLYLEVYPD